MFSRQYRKHWSLNPYNVDLDSIVDMIRVLTKPHCWHGNGTELLKVLHSMDSGASLPPTGGQLASLLEMVAGVLEDQVFIDCFKEEGQQIINLHRVTDNKDAFAAGPESARDDRRDNAVGEGAGIQ